jgi:hypothetical protein
MIYLRIFGGKTFTLEGDRERERKRERERIMAEHWN